MRSTLLNLWKTILEWNRQEEARDIVWIAAGMDDNDEEAHLDDALIDTTQEQTNDADNDGEWIGQGKCELCKQVVMLTKHHLIPKSTHAHIETKLQHATTAIM